MTTEKAGLYVHVPFCVSKCPYCAFTSGTDLDVMPDFLDALEREIEARADPALDADSIHLGGGTPSLLSTAGVGRILGALSRSFGIDPAAEITLEANPGTVSPDALRGFRKEGVNRLTLGAQSFSPEDLAFLGRIHVPAETRAAFEAAREAGFDNLGIDLIYGLPGRTISHWIEQMVEAVALGPEHISCYALSFEGGTPMDRRRAEGAFAPPGEEDAREAFLETHRFLESRRFPSMRSPISPLTVFTPRDTTSSTGATSPSSASAPRLIPIGLPCAGGTRLRRAPTFDPAGKASRPERGGKP